MATLEFHDDPAAFLAAAGDHLAADPVLSTVVASVTARLATRGLPPGPDEPRWWLVVRDDAGAVVGVAMRTAPFRPFPPYVLPMPDDAAVALARTLHERGEELGGVNGALPAVRLVAEETARLTGGTVETGQHMRLFDLPALVEPRPAAGRLRTATADDEEVVLAWFTAFHADADEQAGRAPSHDRSAAISEAEVRARIDDGIVGLWEVDGRVVHMTAWNPPAYGVARVGPVYTPREERGHGYASAAVAEVSRRLVAAGALPCLFTDQANPTSNKIYEALGYRRLVDLANLRIV